MLAQTLYQVAGRPESGISHYTDVPDDTWCYAAVSWASAAGVMSGSGSVFDPERAPARQELAVALYRFAQASDLDTEERADLSGYAHAHPPGSVGRRAARQQQRRQHNSRQQHRNSFVFQCLHPAFSLPPQCSR